MAKTKTRNPMGLDPTDLDLIGRIADRAVALYARHGHTRERLDVLLDVMAVHKRIHKLRLQELFDADDGNFAHDIGGIARHLDRENYALLNCFVPRYCAPQAA